MKTKGPGSLSEPVPVEDPTSSKMLCLLLWLQSEMFSTGLGVKPFLACSKILKALGGGLSW